MIRILVADDHTVVRSGLRQMLSREPDMQIAGEAGNAKEVMEAVHREAWDVLILDIGMPGRGGIEILRDVKQQCRNLPVLILSMYPEDQYAVRSIKAGADGYLSKDIAPEELIKAIRKVLRGQRYISEGVAERLAEAMNDDSDILPHEALSDREYQVLCMIASGKTVSQIAADFSLSVKTVSTYRARLLEKMKLKNNAELTHYAFNHKLSLYKSG